MRQGTYPTEGTIALHLLGGVWIASCPGCGLELASGRDQRSVEQSALITPCDVCDPQEVA